MTDSGTIRLRDGRALGYAAYGDPAGAPVLSFLEASFANEASRHYPALYPQAHLQELDDERHLVIGGHVEEILTPFAEE